MQSISCCSGQACALGHVHNWLELTLVQGSGLELLEQELLELELLELELLELEPLELELLKLELLELESWSWRLAAPDLNIKVYQDLTKTKPTSNAQNQNTKTEQTKTQGHTTKTTKTHTCIPHVFWS
jgi:hypothetical protein